MLHDFSFKRRTSCSQDSANPRQSESDAEERHGNNMNMALGEHGRHELGNYGSMNMGPAMAMDLNDIDYDAFLANDARSPIRGHPHRPGGRPAAVDQWRVGDAVLDRSRCAQRQHRRRRRPSCTAGAVAPAPSSMAQRLDVLIVSLGTVPIQSSRRSRATGTHGHRPCSVGAPCRASPRRPEKMRRRSIARLNVASKRSTPGAAARPT